MARKKRSKSSNELVNMESTLKKLQSQLVDPDVQRWMVSGARGVRERLLKVNYSVIRNLSDKIPLINGIINARSDQIMPFCNFTFDPRETGFTIVPADREKQIEQRKQKNSDDPKILELADFFTQTGFKYDPDREDDLFDYTQQVVREVYTIDQIATELQYNRIGEPVAFWLLDGSTIRRVTDESDWANNIRFVQMIDDKVYNKYTHEQLIFDYRYKRTDIRYRGYGYSPVEQAVDIITTLLFGYNYVRDQLVRDRMPKGFISVMGDVDQPQMDAIRSYWYAAMSGAGGQWNIPILPSGKDGIGLDFKVISQSNKDMEYHKMMMFVSSLIAAVFSIDLMELGIKADDSQKVLSEPSAAPRLEHSQNRGLNSMLGFLQQHLNKVLRKITVDYKFEWTGVKLEDEAQREDIRVKRLQTTKTINELRAEDGEPPLDPKEHKYADYVLNPQAVQLLSSLQQAEMQKEQMAMMGEMDEADGMDDDEGGDAAGTPRLPGGNGLSKAFSELTQKKERVIRHIIE